MKARNLIRSILFAVVLSALIGCQDKDNNSPAPPPPAPEQPKPKSSCEILRETYTQSDSTITAVSQTAVVERVFQRVIRKDCQGNVSSEGIETVVSPHVTLDLPFEDGRRYKSVFVFNSTTCDHGLSIMPVMNIPLLGALYAITGSDSDGISIKGDLSKALLTLHLAEGINNIFVTYHHDCMPKHITGNERGIVGDPSLDCETSQDSTTVMYPISVTYSEKTLEGTKTVDMLPSSCESAESK